MILQPRTANPVLWSELGKITSVCQEISDDPVLLYGSMALNYYGSAQSPVDIDLLVSDVVEPQMIDALESIGYVPEFSPYLGVIYKHRTESIEIHDFQKYSDDFFLFAAPHHGCKWEDLLCFSVDSEVDCGVKLPTLHLCFVMYAKYLHDWIYLDSIAKATSAVKSEVDAKWPRLLRSFGDLLTIVASQRDDAEQFILNVFNVARKLSLVPAISKLPFYLQLLSRFDPLSAATFNGFLDNAAGHDLIAICDDQTRVKRCGDHFYFFQPSTGRLIEITGDAVNDFVADKEFDCPTPHAASIQITSRCNLTCAHCAFTHESDVMDLKVFRRILTNLASLGVFEVNLGEGGEATLHPELAELARVAHDEYGFVVNLTSNLARPLSDDLLTALDSTLSSVHCSFDELHFASADYRATLVRNLQKLRDRLKCELGINIAYKSGELAGASMALDDALMRFGDVVGQISVLKVSTSGSPWTLDDVDVQELDSMFTRINDAGLRIGFHSCDESAARVFNSISNLPPVAPSCPAWKDFIYVDVFGRVSPCGIRQSNHVYQLEILNPKDFAVDPLSDTRDCRMCAYDCN